MKKSFILSSFMISALAFAQIGINTDNPQGAFHIDGAKDNSASGVPTNAQQANDVIITGTGNTGIGTTSPTTKLHINSATTGAIRITDGNQAAGKVLTSDANGVGTWDLAPIVYKSATSQTAVSITTINTWVNSNLSVLVPETGYYYINFNSRAFFNGTWADGAYWKSELRKSSGASVGTVFGAHASSPGLNNADVTSSFSTVALLTKGENLSLWFWGTSIFTCIGDGNGASSITIFRLGS